MLQIRQLIHHNLSLLLSLRISKDHNVAGGCNIKDLLSLVRISQCEISVSKMHVIFSHFEVAVSMILHHEPSPVS